jgi:hypothetical protein
MRDYQAGSKLLTAPCSIWTFLKVASILSGLKENLAQNPRCGYELIGHFIIGEDTWWNEYYAPLTEKLNEIRAKHANDKNIVNQLSSDQWEVDGFKEDKEQYRSVFFL